MFLNFECKTIKAANIHLIKSEEEAHVPNLDATQEKAVNVVVNQDVDF